MKNWYLWKANLTVHDGEFEYNQDIYIEGAKTEEEAMSEARYQASIWFNDEEPAEPYCEADDSWEERSGYRIISLQGVRRIEGWQELLSSVYPVKFMKRNGTNLKKECKPLSAKADSFSLPSPNEGGREVRVVYETPTTNISRSDSISG